MLTIARITLAVGMLIAVPASAQKLQTRVWVNHGSKVYHCPGTRYYGKTKDGEYMVEAAARGSGNRAAGGKGCENSAEAGLAPLPDESAESRRMVWLNTESGVYYCPNTSDWGTTRRGRYLTESDATASGHKPAAGTQCGGKTGRSN